MNNTAFHNCNTMSVTTMHKYYHFDDIVKVNNRKKVHANLYDHLSLLSNLNHNFNPIKPWLFEICQPGGGGGIYPRPVTPLFEG